MSAGCRNYTQLIKAVTRPEYGTVGINGLKKGGNVTMMTTLPWTTKTTTSEQDEIRTSRQIHGDFKLMKHLPVSSVPPGQPESRLRCIMTQSDVTMHALSFILACDVGVRRHCLRKMMKEMFSGSRRIIAGFVCFRVSTSVYESCAPLLSCLLPLVSYVKKFF